MKASIKSQKGIYIYIYQWNLYPMYNHLSAEKAQVKNTSRG